MRKEGFTLVELMVVVGIIAVLMAALIGGFGKSTKVAEKAKIQELVSNTATALNTILLHKEFWPEKLVQYNNKQLDENVSQVFARNGLLGLSFKTTTDSTTGQKTYRLSGQDRCGIVDHFAQRALSKTTSSSSSLKVQQGGTVKDHTLWYAIDDDGDGFTEVNGGEIGSFKVRASQCVWSAGMDGHMEAYDPSGRTDDVYSWQSGQVER